MVTAASTGAITPNTPQSRLSRGMASSIAVKQLNRARRMVGNVAGDGSKVRMHGPRLSIA
jgi:hypothetical protein